MTDLNIFEGNDKTWSVTLTTSGTGEPFNITGDEFLFTVKDNINDSDSDSLRSCRYYWISWHKVL